MIFGRCPAQTSYLTKKSSSLSGSHFFCSDYLSSYDHCIMAGTAKYLPHTAKCIFNYSSRPIDKSHIKKFSIVPAHLT